MKVLIVGLVKNPQLKRLQQEGEKKGHIVDGCYVGELVITASKNGFFPSLRGKSLADYNLVYLWSVGKKRWEWYVTCLFLSEKYSTRIVNNKVVDPTYNLYLSPFMNYYKQFKEKLPFPKSSVVFSSKSIKTIVNQYQFPIIVKKSQGRQGRGVYKVENIQELENLVTDMEKEKEPIIIREFIPNDGDIRVFTVGYKVIGAMKRTPTKGDFRSNISLGGLGQKYDLAQNPEIISLAEKVSSLTGTEIAGVDIMINKDTNKPFILEVNPGPQFTGLEKYTGVNAAEKIIEYFGVI